MERGPLFDAARHEFELCLENRGWCDSRLLCTLLLSCHGDSSSSRRAVRNSASCLLYLQTLLEEVENKRGTFSFCVQFVKKFFLLKGNSHQILLSEMSLPGVEVLIEKLLPQILGRLGKKNPSKRRCKVAFVQRKCAVTSTVSVRFLYASYN